MYCIRAGSDTKIGSIVVWHQQLIAMLLLTRRILKCTVRRTSDSGLVRQVLISVAISDDRVHQLHLVFEFVGIRPAAWTPFIQRA